MRYRFLPQIIGGSGALPKKGRATFSRAFNIFWMYSLSWRDYQEWNSSDTEALRTFCYLLATLRHHTRLHHHRSRQGCS